MDDYAEATGTIATVGRDRIGVRTAVGCPIVVGGRIWGAIAAGRYRSEAFPAETEAALTRFADLAATAVVNAEARAEVERLAEEQTALRRVATLVAKGVEPAELFSAVTQEVAGLFSTVQPPFAVTVIRFDPGPEFVLAGASIATDPPIGTRWSSTDFYVSTRVHRTGGSARVDAADLEVGGPEADTLRRQGFLYQVGSPIVVEGRLWGAMTTNSAEPLPPDADQRLEKFTELVATAIANTESRAEVERLAAEQAALRRVATLSRKGPRRARSWTRWPRRWSALGADAAMLRPVRAGRRGDRGRGSFRTAGCRRGRAPATRATA
jgi:GAF domain-containing protein